MASGLINAGRDDRIILNQVAHLVFDIIRWRPRKILHDRSKPERVVSRAADLRKARKILGWKPKVSYSEGFEKTIDWCFSNKDKEKVRTELTQLLMER